MEETVCSKMKDFMTVIDQVRKYRALLAALPDFAIIMALSMVVWLSGSLLSNLGTVFVSYIHTDWYPLLNFLQVLAVLMGIIIGVFWVNRKVKSVKVRQWRSALDEGAPGAIKLLQETNWEDIFKDIRYAKIGFWFYGLLKTAAIWLLTLVIYYGFISGFLWNTLHVNTDFTLIGLFLLALAFALNWNDLRKRYDKVGRLDALLWELRWFDSEFRRADFKT